MIEKRLGLITIFLFEKFLQKNEVKHFISTRRGGLSDPPCHSLNLGLHVGDDPKRVLENRKRLVDALGIPLSHLTLAQQIHSGNVTVISEEMRGQGSRSNDDAISETDAMVTDIPGICLAVLVADCVPLLFFDPSKRVIGVAHAGWKGTVHGIGPKTVRVMETAFGSSAQDILVGMGPSIGPCCYQVGPEVIARVEDNFDAGGGYILHESNRGTGYFDLWKANLGQLVGAGIKPNNVEMANTCTNHNPDRFFSYRKQEGDTGRFGAGIVIC